GAYPTISVEAHVADFEEEFVLPGEPGRRLVAFLGGTIGNLNDVDRADFLLRLRAAMEPGDHLLLGADLVKDIERLVTAYDDSAGVTAAFNRNIIDVVVRELHVENLSADDFRHVARWNAERSRIEMWLRAVRDVDAWFPTLDMAWQLPADGELILDETVGAPPESRYVTFSVTKAFTGGLAWQLMGEGLLGDQTRVADVVPEFAGNRKQDVTVEHLLTHTAGFPRAPMRPEEGADRAARVERMATWRLDWPAGTQTEY